MKNVLQVSIKNIVFEIDLFEDLNSKYLSPVHLEYATSDSCFFSTI